MLQAKVYRPYFKNFSLASVNQCITEKTGLSFLESAMHL